MEMDWEINLLESLEGASHFLGKKMNLNGLGMNLDEEKCSIKKKIFLCALMDFIGVIGKD